MFKKSFLIFLLVLLMITAFIFIPCPGCESPPANTTQPPTTTTTQPPVTTTPQPTTTTPPLDEFHLIRSHPADIDNSLLPVTPTDELHYTGFPPQEVDIAEYRLTIDGLVDNPLTLTYEDMKAYSSYTEVVLLICPGFFFDNAEWTGVPLTTIFDEAGLQAEATEITFYAMDTYKKTLPLDGLLREGVFLAYEVNGETIPLDHGYPLRLVVKWEYGWDWVKWIERIEIS